MTDMAKEYPRFKKFLEWVIKWIYPYSDFGYYWTAITISAGIACLEAVRLISLGPIPFIPWFASVAWLIIAEASKGWKNTYDDLFVEKKKSE